MANYITNDGFDLNSEETSQVVDMIVAALMQKMEIDHGNLPDLTNRIVKCLYDGLVVSGHDNGFLNRVAALAPEMIGRLDNFEYADLDNIIVHGIGDSFGNLAKIDI